MIQARRPRRRLHQRPESSRFDLWVQAISYPIGNGLGFFRACNGLDVTSCVYPTHSKIRHIRAAQQANDACDWYAQRQAVDQKADTRLYKPIQLGSHD